MKKKLKLPANNWAAPYFPALVGLNNAGINLKCQLSDLNNKYFGTLFI